MKVTGIIAEYNPFHNGHAYHLQKTREDLGSDFIVVVMSGNYVQRGAPTIIDKYSRCEMALKCGADLVLELPSCFSTASAEYFAFGGVAILDKLGIIDNLCFGTESLDSILKDKGKVSETDSENILDYFRKIAALLIDEPEDFKLIVKECMKNGMSNAAAISEAVEKTLGVDYRRVMETSNNILAVEYLKALMKLNSSIEPEPIARMLSAHNDSTIMEGFSSATSIRNAIYNKYEMTSLSSTVPDEVFSIMMDRYLESFPVFRDDFSVMLGAKLLEAKSANELTEYFGVSEDLANRLFNNRNSFRSFNQYRELINTKSISLATVGRALMHITLDIKTSDMDRMYNIESLKNVRVLGFKKSAECLLTEIKKNGRINLITKLADYKPEKDGEPDMIMQTLKSDMLYRMICMNKFDVDLKTPFEEQITII